MYDNGSGCHADDQLCRMRQAWQCKIMVIQKEEHVKNVQ